MLFTMSYTFRTVAVLALLAGALLVSADTKPDDHKVQGHQHHHGGSNKPNGLDTSLDITDYSHEFQGSPAVGASFVSKFKFRDDSTNVVADVVMTGVVTAYEEGTGSFEVNAMMISESIKFKDATLIAAGRLAWDGATKQIVKSRDSLVIMGGDAYLAGAAGTVVLAGGKDTKQTANFNIILPPRPKPRNL